MFYQCTVITNNVGRRTVMNLHSASVFLPQCMYAYLSSPHSMTSLIGSSLIGGRRKEIVINA